PANGHSYVSAVIDPTCTEDGYTLWECENCDASYTSDEVTATGHKWDEGTITTPPTAGCEGVRTFRCTACGEEMTEPVPALEDEEPASETQPAGEDQNPSDNASGEGVCAFCGEVHDRSFSGRFIAFFHAIFAFFKRLFGA
ncbi:MAG: hypothetical protein IIZ66_01650, partial [Clostridia bacterium]|nr:hypothetical protein [Clostridia bacterium]